MKVKIKNSFFELTRFNKLVVQNIVNKDFPFKIGYWIGYFFNKVNQESVFYFKEKEKLFEKYAEKDKKGKIKTEKETQNIVFKDRRSFNEDLIKLQRIEIEIPVNKIKVNLNDLEEKRILLKPLEFDFINPIFDVQEEQQEEEKEKTPPKEKKKKKKKLHIAK